MLRISRDGRTADEDSHDVRASLLCNYQDVHAVGRRSSTFKEASQIALRDSFAGALNRHRSVLPPMDDRVGTETGLVAIVRVNVTAPGLLDLPDW